MTNRSQYEDKGYLVIKNFFTEYELKGIRNIVQKFHESWKQKNSAFYAEGAVNSAYLTGNQHLEEADRELLFKFIGSAKLMDVASSVMEQRPTFMNTQLFFNPVDQTQNNYWHRDPQYHLSIEEQQQALFGPEIIHFRIPLVDEPGVELVPGTHKRWDTDEELDVRLEQNQRNNYGALSTGIRIELDVGDLLVFSANMIHRGLYGLNRLSFDILFCDPEPSLAAFVDEHCLPSESIIRTLENADAFLNTKELMVAEENRKYYQRKANLKLKVK